MTAGNQGSGIRDRRDRLWFRRLFTIGGAGVLVWLYLKTLAVAAAGAALGNVLLALVGGIAAICGYYVKRRADAEEGGLE